MINLTISSNRTNFKISVLSKITHLALNSTISKGTVIKIEKIQREFIWFGGTPKINHSTFCTNYKNGGTQDVDIMRIPWQFFLLLESSTPFNLALSNKCHSL